MPARPSPTPKLFTLSEPPALPRINAYADATPGRDKIWPVVFVPPIAMVSATDDIMPTKKHLLRATKVGIARGIAGHQEFPVGQCRPPS